MDDLQKQIDELGRKIDLLDGRIPKTLQQDLELAKRAVSEAAIAVGPAVSNSPTATGYIPTIINGKRVNLMTGS